MSDTPNDTVPADASSLQPKLHCLEGEQAPAGMAPALLRLLEVADTERGKLGEVLFPSLVPMEEEELNARIGELCEHNGFDPAKVGGAVKATVFLFRQAAMFDLSVDELRKDIAALGGEGELTALLVPLYTQVATELRQSIAVASVAAHGKLLTNVEWRVDTLGASSRGRKLNLPVAMLTFHYQEGQQPGSITLQMMPDAVAGLRQVCDQLLNE